MQSNLIYKPKSGLSGSIHILQAVGLKKMPTLDLESSILIYMIMLKKFGKFLMRSIWDTGRVAFRQYSGLSGSRPKKLLILGFESSTFTYISMLKKFGHFLMNSSRDTGGGFRSPPPVRGKDILIPYGRGLICVKNTCLYLFLPPCMHFAPPWRWPESVRT